MARATRATVLAEKEVANVHVDEAEVFLQLARDAVEAAEARVQLASDQLAQVLDQMLFPNARKSPLRIPPITRQAETYNFIPQRDQPQYAWPRSELEDTPSSGDSDPTQTTDFELCDDDLGFESKPLSNIIATM